MGKVKFVNVSKTYPGGVEAVKNFDLTITDKEFIVFVGPSGCGKSTVLRMLAGLEELTSGDVYIDEKKVNDLEPSRRDVAMVFQNYALYPHMTVYENISMGLLLRKVNKKEIAARVEQAVNALEIEDILDRVPSALSGGQQQRVALARTIVRNPNIFLMDEPLSNLDATLRVQMRSEIIDLHQRIGKTFVYVTHDQVEAMTMGNRIVVMDKGVIQQVDTPMNIYHKPANSFVAKFIGTPQMNLMNATHSNNFLLQGKEVNITERMLKRIIQEGMNKQSFVLGIRPEHVSLQPVNEGLNIQMKVTVIEHLGYETLIHGLYQNEKLVIKAPGSFEVQKGELLELYLAIDKLHFFAMA